MNPSNSCSKPNFIPQTRQANSPPKLIPQNHPSNTEVLGTGAFSVVKMATGKDGEKLAVKVVERRNLGPGDLDAMRSEVKLLGELDHPNIIKLHGWYEEEATLYMALELCEGKGVDSKGGQGDLYTCSQMMGVWFSLSSRGGRERFIFCF